MTSPATRLKNKAKAAELSASADTLFLAQQFVDAIDQPKTAAHREAA